MTNCVVTQQAYIKTEAYGYAISDADKAIEIDPKLIKVRTVSSPRGGRLFVDANHLRRRITAEALREPPFFAQRKPSTILKNAFD